jgi:7-cyano-7-deazaguanine synthase
MRDIYAATLWSIEGRPPGYHTPDEDVYLPGRNIVLLGKAAILCAATNIGRLAIGTLDHNPFPDATPAFRQAMATALSLGLAHDLRIDAPYARLSKSEVVRRGVAAGVPMALTLSCMNPITLGDRFPRHCGVCSKCRERHDAFVAAEVADPTDYADLQFVRA